MTNYTDNRGYPFPSSERETGNGGLHSELLARAVARDLDNIDAEWAALLQRPTIIRSKAADETPYFSGGESSVQLDTTDKLVGTALAAGPLGVKANTAGWYHATTHLHVKANGTITAGALHRLSLTLVRQVFGTSTTMATYYTETFQAGSLDNYLVLDVPIHMLAGDELRLRYYHLNTGSDCRAVASGTRLSAVQIVED